MAFIIQDVENEKYLKHDGTNNDHPYNDVDKPEDAEQFPSFKHACYAAFWFADTNRKWRIIDRTTGECFTHHKGQIFKPEKISELYWIGASSYSEAEKIAKQHGLRKSEWRRVHGGQPPHLKDGIHITDRKYLLGEFTAGEWLVLTAHLPSPQEMDNPAKV